MRSDFSLFLNMNERLQNFSFLRFKDKLVLNKKNVTAFSLLLIVASLVLGSTVFFMNGSVARLVQLAGFLALGYLHVNIMQGNLAVLTQVEKLVYSFVLTFAVFVFLSVLYLFTGAYHLPLVLAAGCSFLLVYVLSELWTSYNTVSESNIMPWYYSGPVSSNQATVFLNSIPIRVNVQIEQHGRVEYPIAFRAPLKMKLSLIFYHMIEEHNESGKTAIEFTDRAGKPYGWIFFTLSLTGWSKSLDPGATLLENKIGPNSVIIARRVSDDISAVEASRPSLINKTSL